jgi:hypothetical protein
MSLSLVRLQDCSVSALEIFSSADCDLSFLTPSERTRYLDPLLECTSPDILILAVFSSQQQQHGMEEYVHHWMQQHGAYANILCGENWVRVKEEQVVSVLASIPERLANKGIYGIKQK